MCEGEAGREGVIIGACYRGEGSVCVRERQGGRGL